MNPTVAGALEIQLLSNLARLQADMAQAKGMVAGTMRDISNAVDQAKSALAGLGLTLTAGGLALIAKNAIDAADAMNDLSKTTGIAVEKLAGLRLASKMSGGDLDGIANSINKLSQNIGKSGEKFAALGISAKDPLEAFKQFADVFSAIDDPQLRAALGAEALGKGWASAAPLLAEGGKKIGEMVEKGEKLSGVTKELTEASDAFNDKLAELAGNGGMVNGILGQMLPLLNAAADGLLALRDGGGGAGSMLGTVLTEALRVVIVLAGNVGFVLRGIGTEIGGIAAQVAAFMSGDFKRAGEIGRMMAADAEAARAKFDAWEASIMAVGTAAAKTAKQTAGMSEEDLEAARIAKDASDAAAKKARAFMAGAEAAGKLAKAQKELGLADAHVIAFLKQEAELRESVAKALADGDDARRKYIGGIEEEIRRQDRQNETLGMTREQIANLVVARLEEQMAILKASGAMETEIAQLQEEIDLRKRLADAVGRGETGRAAIEAQSAALRDQASVWNEIGTVAGDFFVDLVTNGKSAFDNLKKWVKDLLAQMIALFAKRWVLNMAAGGSVLGSAADAMAGGTGSGTSAGSLLSTAASLYSTGSTFASAYGAGMGLAGSASLALTGTAGVGPVASGAAYAASLGAGGSAGMMGGVYTALAAIPVWGWIAMAVIAIGAWIAGNHKGGPKVGGSFMGSFDGSGAFGGGGSVPGTDNGRFFTPNQGDAVVQGLVEGVGKGFFDTLARLGGTTSGFNFGLGFDHDPNGTARSRVSSMLTDSSGRVIYSAMDREMDDKEVDAAMQLEAQRLILAALQNSQLPEEVSKILNSVVAAGATAEDIQRVIAAATEMKQVIDALAGLGVKGLDIKALQAFQLEGESIGQTFQRVGGAWAQFQDLFYSDAEKIAAVQDQVAAVFADLGIAVPTSAEAFRALVESIDVSTDAGRKMFLALTGVAPAFRAITNAAEAAVTRFNTLATTLSPSFGAANARSVLEARVRTWMGLTPGNGAAGGWDVESTIGNIGKLVREGKIGEALTYAQSLGGNAVTVLNDMLEAYIAWTTAMQNAQGPVTSVGTAISGLADAAARAAEQMKGAKEGLWAYLQGLLVNPQLSPLGPAEQLREARGQFFEQLRLAQGGDLGAASGLQGYIDRVLTLGRDASGSGSAYIQLFREITSAAAEFAKPGGAKDLQRDMYMEARTGNDLMREVRQILLDIRDRGTADGDKVADSVESSALSTAMR